MRCIKPWYVALTSRSDFAWLDACNRKPKAELLRKINDMNMDKEIKSMYQILGYYICEKIKIPDCLGLGSDTMLSVSTCFGGVHPDLTQCYFVNHQAKANAKSLYQQKWNLEDSKALMLQQDISKLFERGLAIDGRFLRLADAAYFYKTYFNKASCMIVSVATTKEYYDTLTNELADCSGCNNDFFTGIADEHELLGYDILGWDISRFHTFLCNSLQNELHRAKFNNFCLLANEFKEVAEFAQAIRDKGEPVEWIPCRIGNCLATAAFQETSISCRNQEVSR